MDNSMGEVSSGGERAANHAPAWCVCRVLSIPAAVEPWHRAGPDGRTGPGSADGSLEPLMS
jgi:hypothetical protein